MSLTLYELYTHDLPLTKETDLSTFADNIAIILIYVNLEMAFTDLKNNSNLVET